MRMEWNDSTIKAFKEASEYTKFHENLARYLKPLLSNCYSLCDIGCGLGIVDMYLSEFIDNITCIDIDKNVIDYLQKEINKKQIYNVKCCCDDYKNIDGFFDVILISFFGYEEIDFFSKHCKKLIVIINDKVNSHLPPLLESRTKEKERYSTPTLEKNLINMNLNYKLEHHSLEFGQVFKNKKEVEEYAKSYDDGQQYEKIYNHIIDNIKYDENMMLYLPYKKSFSIFSIDF